MVVGRCRDYANYNVCFMHYRLAQGSNSQYKKIPSCFFSWCPYSYRTYKIWWKFESHNTVGPCLHPSVRLWFPNDKKWKALQILVHICNIIEYRSGSILGLVESRSKWKKGFGRLFMKGFTDLFEQFLVLRCNIIRNRSSLILGLVESRSTWPKIKKRFSYDNSQMSSQVKQFLVHRCKIIEHGSSLIINCSTSVAAVVAQW